jgi:hypothetical protein
VIANEANPRLRRDTPNSLLISGGQREFPTQLVQKRNPSSGGAGGSRPGPNRYRVSP